MALMAAVGALLVLVSLSLTCVHCSGLPGPTPKTGGTRRTTGEILAQTLVELNPNPGKQTYFVRPGGGSRSQCTGRANADYPGRGLGQACAFKHPFLVLPPGGATRMEGGDTLIIGSGSYRMGIGAPGAGACEADSPWKCHMPPIPSGTAAAPTQILGQGWGPQCKAPPTLWGTERADQVIDLRGSSHVRLHCLEITDHSACVEHHGAAAHRCNRDTAPYGDWAAAGIRAADSANVSLQQLYLHGLAHTGIQAGRIRDWSLVEVRISGNGWCGWDGDLGSGSSSNSGRLLFSRVTIDHNGCAESYPGSKPTGCWGQSAGGYGDGLGTAATGGDWIFEDCRILHNTSDGLDLLYHSLGGRITIRRTRAEGNAGNQVKVTGDATIVNSVLVGNCAYFAGKPFTHQVDHCRALGNTLELFFQPGKQITLVNNTLFGNGDVLVDVGVRTGSCDGTEKLTAINNIFLAGKDHNQPSETAALFFKQGCASLTFDADYGVIHNVKDQCKYGPHDLCKDPRLGPLAGDAYGMSPRAGSPAIDSGKGVGGAVPAVDLLGRRRPRGAGVDRGALEVGGR